MRYPRREIPRVLRVKQRLKKDRLSEVRRSTRERLLAAGMRERVKPGARIGITAGSRGMGGFAELLGGIIDALKSCGAEPFIIPAMGSHGGATAEGQKNLLLRLGLRPEALGVEIRATMDTICLGRSKSGAEAHLDRHIHEADGVIVLGRVKTHPENTEGIASGLLKMVTVGLGKQAGAQEAHSHGLWESVLAVPEITLGTGRVLFGVAVVENAFREPVVVEVAPGNFAGFEATDRRLLKVAKEHFARVPYDELDVLVVDQVGKNVSGSGMDVNVIGKWRVSGGEKKPHYKRIVALSLTPESAGNGLGIGLADFTTERFERALDRQATYINLLTATEPGTRNTVEGPMPPVLTSDREAIEVGLYSALANPPRLCRIKNTADLEEFWISEALAGETRENGGLEIVGEPTEFQFDAAGNLF